MRIEIREKSRDESRVKRGSVKGERKSEGEESDVVDFFLPR